MTMFVVINSFVCCFRAEAFLHGDADGGRGLPDDYDSHPGQESQGAEVKVQHH